MGHIPRKGLMGLEGKCTCNSEDIIKFPSIEIIPFCIHISNIALYVVTLGELCQPDRWEMVSVRSLSLIYISLLIKVAHLFLQLRAIYFSFSVNCLIIFLAHFSPGGLVPLTIVIFNYFKKQPLESTTIGTIPGTGEAELSTNVKDFFF